MSFQWWKWLHIVGAFAFVAAHGVSMGVSFRLRKERDPGRVTMLLQLSGSANTFMYVGLLVLLVAGIVAGFQLNAWGRGWIWTALGVLAGTIAFMFAMAFPYYRRVRTIADALAGGSRAVTPEQFAELLASRRPYLLAAVGGAALLIILWLMVLKPF